MFLKHSGFFELQKDDFRSFQRLNSEVLFIEYFKLKISISTYELLAAIC